MTKFQKAKVSLLKARKEFTEWRAKHPDLGEMEAADMDELKRLTVSSPLSMYQSL